MKEEEHIENIINSWDDIEEPVIPLSFFSSVENKLQEKSSQRQNLNAFLKIAAVVLLLLNAIMILPLQIDSSTESSEKVLGEEYFNDFQFDFYSSLNVNDE